MNPVGYRDIRDVVRERGISEILHFTTSEGLIGISATGAILPRSELPKEQYLEHVYTANAQRRKDVSWFGYVNLSLSRVNQSFFTIARKKWHAHRDIYWCVLAFSPEILEHNGVVFATTNNMYTGVRHYEGAAGLESLFAPEIHQYQGSNVKRSSATNEAWPTCRQAEVLYPGRLSLEHLKTIYVYDDSFHDDVYGLIASYKKDFPVLNSVRVLIDRSVFDE